MNLARKILIAASLAATAAVTSWARPTVLSLGDHPADSAIVFPESVETDTRRLMENWYLTTYTALDRDVDSRPDVEVTDQELIARLQAIPTTIELPFNSIVRAYINLYTSKKRSLVESMLGMSLYYMPIFEQELECKGLPIELKYLPVIESALDPDAVSRAGATGLWQLMLPTARGLGMEVNTLVDERRDPVRSSQAATTYLKQLYDIYGDWSLAIAAYNCGPGNVNKALRRAQAADAPLPDGTAAADAPRKDFWAIYPYLPKETRGYVPCFIAATYVMNHYDKHNISPALAKRPILTDSVHVRKRIHFQQIADVLNIPVEELKILNPQYRKQIIPGDIREYPLVLPAHQVYAFIMSEDAIAGHDATLYARRDAVEPATEAPAGAVAGRDGDWVISETVKYHKVRKGETMASIAKKYGVSLRSLRNANGGVRKPKRGARLKVVTTERVWQPRPQEEIAANTPPEGDNLLVPSPTADTAAADKDVAQAASGEAAPAPEENAPAVDNSAEGDDNLSLGTVVGAAAPTTAAKETTTEAPAKVQKAAPAKKEQPKKEQPRHAKKEKKQRPYTVRNGDTLWKIAKKNGTTVEAIQKANGLSKNAKIQPGQKLKLK